MTNPVTTSYVVDNPPAPGTEQWLRTITASKVPTILGLSKWSSPYALWHTMAGNIPAEHLEGDHLDWGHIIEPALVGWWAHCNPGWRFNPPRKRADGVKTTEIAYSDDSLPFPNLVTLDRRATRGGRRPKFHIVECKTDRDRTRWGYPEDGDSVPADYLTQVMFQMGVSGIHAADIVVQLGGSGVPEVHPVPFDPDMFANIVAACTAWHESLQTAVEPPLDDTTATYDAVRGLHPDIDRGEEVVIDPAAAAELWATTQAEKDAKKAAKGAKTAVLHAMGNAQYAVTDTLGGTVKVADRRANGHGSVSLYPAKPQPLDGEA